MDLTTRKEIFELAKELARTEADLALALEQGAPDDVEVDRLSTRSRLARTRLMDLLGL